MTPTRIRPYFDDYAAFHRTRGNERCHYFGISAIVISLLGLLAPLGGSANWPTGSPFFRLDAAVILLVAAWAWYFYLDWKLAAPFALISYGLYFIGRAIPFPALWALFVAGWILQFIGHYAYEKKSPAFYKNLAHLLIGPIWVFGRLTGLST